MFWRRSGCKETGWRHGLLPLWTVWKTKEKHVCLKAVQLCMNSRICSLKGLFSSCWKDSWSCLGFLRSSFTQMHSPSLFQACHWYHHSLDSQPMFLSSTSICLSLTSLPLMAKTWCIFPLHFAGIYPSPDPTAALGWAPLLSLSSVSAFFLVGPLNLGGAETLSRHSFGVIQT